MVCVKILTAFLSDFLSVNTFKDYGPNGLQVAGQGDIQLIVTGVTATQNLIEAAVRLNADAILVHHGLFWHKQEMTLVGMQYARVKALMDANIHLLAYHLPLDVHSVVGNNVQLAHRLGLQQCGFADAGGTQNLLIQGELKNASTPEAFAQTIKRVLNRAPLHIQADRPIKKVVCCTGAAQGFIEQAIELGADAYVSGEISEQTVHIARENGIHYFAAGHYATEQFGVQALGAQLEQHFNIKTQFVDDHNPV